MINARGLTIANMDPQDEGKLPRAKSYPHDPNGAVGEIAHMVERAARGELDAQRTLRNIATNAAFTIGAQHPNSLICATEMIMTARTCAAHRQPEDVRSLAGALCFASDALRNFGQRDEADHVTAEAISILERLGNAGDEYGAVASDQLVTLYPTAGAIAQILLGKEC